MRPQVTLHPSLTTSTSVILRWTKPVSGNLRLGIWSERASFTAYIPPFSGSYKFNGLTPSTRYNACLAGDQALISCTSFITEGKFQSFCGFNFRHTLLIASLALLISLAWLLTFRILQRLKRPPTFPYYLYQS